MNILIHGTVIGLGGIAHHTREFSKALSKYHNVKIRNFNVDHNVWDGYNGTNVFENIKELEPVHHCMLYEQTLWEDGKLKEFKLSGYDGSFIPDIHIVMTEANHHYHYQNYNKPVIAYFPWETTKLYQDFLNRLQKFDGIWVPSEWQKKVLVESGVDNDKISVVNEGVDPNKFHPIKKERDGKLKILHIGPWEYRKSTYEIIRTFLNLFENNEDVELRLSVHSKINSEYDTPENTFKKYGLPLSKNIVFLNTLSEDEYIKEIQNADLYLSCSRSEGWNLPLIQSLSSGIPSIYSKCSGQLEFTNELTGIGIDINGQYPATRKLKVNDVDWCWDVYGDYPGDLYEPNYEQLEKELFNFYSSYKNIKDNKVSDTHLKISKFIHEKYNWDVISQKTNEILKKYKNNKMKPIYYLIHSISFGDTLAATPTLRYLAQSHNQKINVVTHKKHIFKNNPNVNQCFSFDEYHNLYLGDVVKYESFTFAGTQDNNGIEKKFSHIDTRQLHAMDLGFQLMPHQMEYEYTPDYVELDYDIPEKYVVCHITQNWSNRTWDTQNWQRLIDWLSENKIFTILIGQDHKEKVHDSISIEPIVKACPKLNNLYGLDLCNKIELEEMYQVIKNGMVLITMDTGPLHIAGCTDTHILQLGSATHPQLRIPYRNNTQNYKYDFVGGSCNIFCNSDLKYNVQEWGHINAVAPLTECSENKPTFECHPPVDKVIKKLGEIIQFQEENKYLNFFELLPDTDEDKINFNFIKTTNDIVDIVVKDVRTGLTRDKFTNPCKRLNDGNYWWAPMPGKVKNLGDIDLYFYLNGEYQGKKRLYYSGGKDLIINGEKQMLDYLDGFDYPTFWEIFINGDYEKQPLCVVEKGDVVLDIGGNKGFFTLNSIQKVASKVYTVEPVKHSFEQITKLTEKFTNVIPINKAVGETDGLIDMFVDSDASATNCVTTYGEMFGRESNIIEVDSININTLLKQIDTKINFMKVDCEGSEFELFKTITDENLKSIDKIVVETHGDEIDQFVHNRLIKTNFEVYKHGDILFAINLN